MKKVISFSLWGDNPKYLIGAIKNAKLAKEVYPDWICRFYISKDTPQEILLSLKEQPNTEIFVMNEPADWTASFWRFYAMGDESIDILISRDTDSRPTLREKEAVDEWINSEKIFHIMRDHPHHGTQILAGMWGCLPAYFRGAVMSIKQFQKNNIYDIDQSWLRTVIYPNVKDKALIHDEFFEKKAFPSARNGLEFVGEALDENDITCNPAHREALRMALIK